MSKQSDAKKAMGFDPKPPSKTCVNCRHLTSEMLLPVWMVEANARRAACGGEPLYGPEYQQQKNLRCAIGTFAVKKMSACKEFERNKK